MCAGMRTKKPGHTPARYRSVEHERLLLLLALAQSLAAWIWWRSRSPLLPFRTMADSNLRKHVCLMNVPQVWLAATPHG
jgi:hypothetical protein